MNYRFWFFLSLAGLAGCGERQPMPASDKVAHAVFDDRGRAVLPAGYRAWVHVGTRYKSPGINILDGLPVSTPEILNAYVEPSTFAAFMKTGVWPEGAEIIKEFSSVRTGEGCDAVSFVCKTSLGEGVFETRFIGLGLMIKDGNRFPNAPGHWGYFTFGHHPEPYDTVATVKPLAACSDCHVRVASKTDYVINAHIGLAR